MSLQPETDPRHPKRVRFFIDDQYVGAVIILNALVLFLLSFRELEDNLILGIIDAIFLVYFLIEAILKIRIMSWKGYMSSGWNRFEFLIVLASIPSLILLFKASLTNLAFIFVFRIIRVLRFFKFVRFIPNLKELVAGVQRAFKASVFVLLAFFVYSFIVSLISCRLYQHTAPELFGDPIRSFYNIFKVFTIEGWYEVPEGIIEQANLSESGAFLTKTYFILIVMSGGIFGLSIVNAIFVEEMVRDNTDELEGQVAEINEKLDKLLAQRSTQEDENSP